MFLMFIKGDCFFSYSFLTNDGCHMLFLVLLSILLSYLPFIFLISHCHFLFAFPVPIFMDIPYSPFSFPFHLSYFPFLFPFPILHSIANSNSPFLFPISTLIFSSPFLFPILSSISYSPLPLPIRIPIPHSHSHFLFTFLFPILIAISYSPSLFLTPITDSSYFFHLSYSPFFTTFARAFSLRLKIDLAHSGFVDHTYSYK